MSNDKTLQTESPETSISSISTVKCSSIKPGTTITDDWTLVENRRIQQSRDELSPHETVLLSNPFRELIIDDESTFEAEVEQHVMKSLIKSLPINQNQDQTWLSIIFQKMTILCALKKHYPEIHNILV